MLYYCIFHYVLLYYTIIYHYIIVYYILYCHWKNSKICLNYEIIVLENIQNNTIT